MTRIITYICSILLVTSCTTNDEGSFFVDLTMVYNQINFENPEVGQISTYLLFRGNDYNSNTSSVSYTGDTLIVRLVSKVGDTYTFSEELTPGSSVYNVNEPYLDNINDIFSSTWSIEGDSLTHTGGTSFHYWNAATIPFTLSEEIQQKTMLQWGASPVTGNAFRINNWTLLDIKYEDILGAVDNSEIPVDGDGYEIIYDKDFGIIRSSKYSPLMNDGFGWDLKLGN